MRNPSPAERLILPLDLSSEAEARAIVDELGDSVHFYKLGYQFLYANGFSFAENLKAEGKHVFIDLKLLDIDNTVRGGIASLCRLKPDFITLHAYPQAMRAAVDARTDPSVNLLAVTVLTSLDDEGLKEAGYKDIRTGELVIKRAHQARDAGIDGVVCSAVEASVIRNMVGPDLLLVTPGIRPKDAEGDDQRRVTTPSMAIENGSDYLVVGRPILNAKDRKAAALSIVSEITEALEKTK
ncbi:MAG: orotidine-5'-phosphate decarboxylase [Pseudomonadota bacterium]